MDRDQVIKGFKEAGFDMVEIIDASPLDPLKIVLTQRKKSYGFLEFEEDNIERRVDPQLSLKGVQSIIVLGFGFNPTVKGNPPVRCGSLSRSAWGRDYHLEMEDRIRVAVDALGIEVLAFVDKGPLSERYLATKAGFGFVGRNQNLIHAQWGSYVRLGYCLTTLPLKSVNATMSSRCGNCRRCIESCPTGAIQFESYDPNRCLSYLTQSKKPWPRALRSHLTHQLFGCDICQEVCPYNKKAKIRGSISMAETCVDMDEFMFLGQRDFVKHYGTRAFSWRGINVLKRNGLLLYANNRWDNDVIHSFTDHLSPLVQSEARVLMLEIEEGD